MTDDLQASWERQNKDAQWHDGREITWGPPSFVALVTAAEATTLRRFYPFTSHWVLRFRTSEAVLETLATIAPGSIALSPSGLYSVQSGLAWHESATTVLTTTDPTRAADALERLLEAWDDTI